MLGLLVWLTDMVWQSEIQFVVSLFPFFLHVDQKDQEWKQNQSVFNTNLSPLHLFIRMTPCGCHFKSSSYKNQSGSLAEAYVCNKFHKYVLLEKRIASTSLFHSSFFWARNTTTRFWPNVPRNVNSFDWLTQTSPPLSIHNTYYSLPYYRSFSRSQFAVSPDSMDGHTSCSPGCCSYRWGGERRTSVLCVSPVC